MNNEKLAEIFVKSGLSARQDPVIDTFYLEAYNLLTQSRQQVRMEMAEEIEKALPKPLEKYRGFPLEVDEKAINETLRRVSAIINNLKVK